MTRGGPDMVRHATASVLLVTVCWGCLVKLSVALARQLPFFWVEGGRGSRAIVGWEGFWEKVARAESSYWPKNGLG